MSQTETLNRRQETLQRLRRWRKNPMVPKSLAYRLCRVSRQRLDALLLSGRVSLQIVDFEEMISVDSLVQYFSTNVRGRKRIKAGRS
jgi:hypothetical protein